MTNGIDKPQSAEEMARLLAEMGKVRLLTDILAAARQHRLTRNDFAVIERRIMSGLDEVRAAASEFPFDVDEAADRAKAVLAELCRRVKPQEWR